MLPVDSSSASSPFSTRSTIASSPDAALSGGEAGSSKYGKTRRPSFTTTLSGQETIQGMYATFDTFNAGSLSASAIPKIMPDRISPSQPHIKPSHDLNQHPLFASPILPAPRAIPSASTSANSVLGHGGHRIAPPRRLIEVEGLPIISVPLAQLAVSTPLGALEDQPDLLRSKLLLQGDPQIIQKRRVETAIRVILDLLLEIPASPSTSSIHPSLSQLLHDWKGNAYSLCRIDSLRAIRLQAGTTTKTPSKRQPMSSTTATDQTAYLEVAVHMSGIQNDGRRVYTCKRCRRREARRKELKDANRKKQSNSESDSSSNRNSLHPTSTLPTQDWITSENPDQYDPQRSSQEVEPPPWDPSRTDWRHEIVLFNSTPEVQVKDGSCEWLPFRVVCYGKCHGEKTGFRIRFTLRTAQGRIIATAETNPIKITDDHKTDKVKPRFDAMSTQPRHPISKSRKARQSGATSRRQSPVPSEGEIVLSRSEVGAIVQKQNASTRAGKPYERPHSQSPLDGILPTDAFQGPLPFTGPGYRRHYSSSSVQSMGSGSDLPLPNEAVNQFPTIGSAGFPMIDASQTHGTVSPGVLRRPHFNGFTAMDGTTSYSSSAAHSRTSSNVASPSSQYMSLSQDDLFNGQHHVISPNDLVQALQVTGFPDESQQLSLQQQSQHQLSDQRYRRHHHQKQNQQQQSQQRLGQMPLISGLQSDHSDLDTVNVVGMGLDNRFDSSSQASLASTCSDPSIFSTEFPDGSIFSQSGLSPDFDDMTTFLDFSGGQDEALQQPTFGSISPIAPTEGNRFSSPSQIHSQMPPSVMLPSMLPLSPPSPSSHAALPFPRITTIIPADGPVGGGTTVAVIGDHFSPDLVVLFGGRTAKLERVSATFIQCLSPPASSEGSVEVTIQGVPSLSGIAPNYFKYNMMDTDLMRLALQVREHYQGSSSDAVYRLAQKVAEQSQLIDQRSEQPFSSPSNHSNPAAGDAHQGYSVSSSQAMASGVEKDLQTTIITFLASLDEASPGSLRRSGAVNRRCHDNHQTLLHIAAVMGFDRLVGRLVAIGAYLDLQDLNGYTPLSLASLCGRLTCARELIEAGAAYDRPTAFGEMPLDLAKVGDNRDVEALLLSAVWSTKPDAPVDAITNQSAETSNGIDNDNPSSESEEDVGRVFRIRKDRRRVKQLVRPPSLSAPPRRSRRASLVVPAIGNLVSPPPLEAPPPYEAPPDTLSWMSRTISSLQHPPSMTPAAMWDRLPIPSFFGPEKAGDHAWVAFPSPSWESLQRIASPEEVKMFTQAMAAAAFNAIVQSGATTSSSPRRPLRTLSKTRDKPQRTGGGLHARRSGSESPVRKVVKHVKRDRMLYLFWLPILLFVGFWLLVTALPLATGFCLIYARQITRAIKQRM